MSRRPYIIGFAILLTAAMLRFRRLGWGLDDLLFFPDEVIWILRGRLFVPLSCGSFAFNFAPNWTAVYPTLYGYLVGLTTALAHAVGLTRPKFGGWPPPPQAAAFYFDLVLIARAVSATIDVLTVVLVGMTATRMYSRRVGLAAAALMAVVPLAAIQVHYASVDPLLMGCFTVVLLACHELMARGTARMAALAGAAAGLAFATKQTGLAALAMLAVPIAARARREGMARGGLLSGVAIAGFGAAVLVGCPPCVLHAPAMLAVMAWLPSMAVTGESALNSRPVLSLGWYGRPFVYQIVASLPYALGWPLYALALGGVVVALRRRESPDRVVLCGLAASFVVLGSFPLAFPRYLMPLFPGLVILAARAVAAPGERPRLRAAMLVGVWTYSLAFAASQVETISFDQQKAVAAWIVGAHPPARDDATRIRVAFPQTMKEYFALADFLERAGLVPVAVPDGRWLDAGTDIFVLPEWLETAIRRDHPASVAARDLDRLTSGTAGYHEVARWRTHYLQRELYARLDPAFYPGLGSYGFTVYARDPAREQLPGRSARRNQARAPEDDRSSGRRASEGRGFTS